MHIQYEGLALPVSKVLVDALINIIPKNVNDDAITFNFRDSTYSPESGVFHPVEIRLERQGNKWHFCYITDFTYVGSGPHAELAKELDFDFQVGVFQNLFGIFPIEQTTDMYQIWESNFLHYWQTMHVYKINVSS